jgi:hypothetical protein
MRFDLQTFADVQAELADLSAAIRALSASQPKAKELADAIDAHLRRGINSMKEDFVGKFAGLIEPFLKSTKADVEKLGGEQTALEDKFTNYLTRVTTALDKQKKEVDKILAADAVELKKLLDENMKKIKGEMAVVGQLVESLRGYDGHFVKLYNSALGLIQSSEETAAKIDDAVARLDQVTEGALEVTTSQAQLTVQQTAAAAERDIKKVSATAQQEMEAARQKFSMVISGPASAMYNHPFLFMAFALIVMLVSNSIIGFGFGWWAVGRNTRQMIDEAVVSATQKVEERLTRIDEQTKTLDTTFQNALYWESLTRYMNNEQKEAFIKQAKDAMERQGRKSGVPKSMTEGAK